ncbi:hypothetical protein, partial [Burkholderia ambifaria]|uniref:hypothetical protein n=1 Tax=Burkholderia ambifaria TaxID=152480 RepID=UPI001ABAC188
YFSVRLLILSLSDPRISSLPSSAHTYRLLIFKEHSARNLLFLSSAAFSAAEKRDYEPSFFARQQLSELLRCDGEGFNFVCAEVVTAILVSTASLPSRAAFPLARKRRDSKHPPLPTQPLCENILRKPPGAAAHGGLRSVAPEDHAGNRHPSPPNQRFLNTGFRFSTNAAIPSF